MQRTLHCLCFASLVSTLLAGCTRPDMTAPTPLSPSSSALIVGDDESVAQGRDGTVRKNVQVHEHYAGGGVGFAEGVTVVLDYGSGTVTAVTGTNHGRATLWVPKSACDDRVATVTVSKPGFLTASYQAVLSGRPDLLQYDIIEQSQ